ncbi:hypothetical protein BG011_009029 [Mortierella polycephala]|uniref:Arrestin C-terminal-like domain-containing protein n=1 Tax=Mortierella polycephala TaxID=41804 RepID=A0A9P6PPY6_9FUNG|nr:hypothetical protein BG011_009029 [Mortierella polycephala]
MAVSPSSSTPLPPSTSPSTTPRSSVTLVFAQGGSTCLLQPNAVVRGHVELKLIKACYASGIRVRLRAEESAIVLNQESNGDSLRQKYQQTVITLFDTEVMVSGSSQDDNELANWQEIAPGPYTFPFALKVPNINLPPCIPGLEGFSIRYVWTAHVDGPFEPSLCSEEVLCQFMPNVLAPKPMEWTYNDIVGITVGKGSTHQLHKPSGIGISIKMCQQVYIPGDPLSMTTTLVNNTPNKIVGIDIILRRTIKGTMAASYANLSNQIQVEMMAESVECKVRPSETSQIDIMTTIPPMGKSYSIPTFESNFLKVYYELLVVIKVKRSVFSGGDTSYQCAIPIPIATHNVDNPTIAGRTPRWTKSRMQPYFFEPGWADPVGDLPGPLSNDTTSNTAVATNVISVGAIDPSANTTSLASASAASLLLAPATNSNAMHEFLNSGSAELHRERTLKKSLTRSKSLKDIQSARINGSSWRAERDQLLNQSRELNKSTADISQSNTQAGPSKKSPPLGPKHRASNEDKLDAGSSGVNSAAVDSNGNVGYTPPPPPALRPQKNAQRELTPEQQAELARKASRRILPNQGLYTNEGVLPQELVNNDHQHQSSSNYGTSTNNNGNSYNSNNANASSDVSYPTPAGINQSSTTNNSSINRIPPRRNASLSQKSYPQPQQSTGNSNYTYDPETSDSVSRGGNHGNHSSGQYESGHPSRGRSNNSSSDQGHPRQGQLQDQTAAERVPYQHSLPAHQQPPGVISPTCATSPSLTGLSSPSLIGLKSPSHAGLKSPSLTGQTSPNATSNPSGTNPSLERSPSRRDVPTTNGILSNLSSTAGDFLPPPPFNKSIKDEAGRQHQRHGSTGSNSGSSNGNFMRIPPWERVEKVHHQNWFRPGPHQSGALQTYDVAGIHLSNVQVIPIMKKTLQRPIDAVRTIECEEHLR